MGWTYFAFFFAYALFEIPGGWMADRWGARKSLTRVVIMWSIFTAATGWAWGLWSLFFIRLLLRRGRGRLLPQRHPGVLRLAAGRRTRPRPGHPVAVGPLGRRLHPAAGGGDDGRRQLAPGVRDLRRAWASCGRSCSTAGTGTGPNTTPRVNKAELKLLEGRATASTHGPMPWGPLLRSRSVKLLWAQYMSINFTWPFYITWLPTYLQEARGLPAAQGRSAVGLAAVLRRLSAACWPA